MITYDIELLIKKGSQWLDKSEYVQLPISIKETLDDTLDLGEVVLNFTPDSEEYEAWSEVRLNITINSSTKKYYMVIQRDNVEELSVGFDSYWKHSLTLIEATHKLSAVQMNDFSLTQPLIVAESAGTSEFEDPFYIQSGSVITAGTSKQQYTDETEWLTNGTITTGRQTTGILALNERLESKLFDFQINRSSLAPKLEYSTVNTYIILPVLPTASFRVGLLKRDDVFFFDWTTGVDLVNDTYRFQVGFHQRLLNVTDGLDVSTAIDAGNNRIRISDLTDGKRYRYIVETGLAQGLPFWDTPANQTKLDSEPTNPRDEWSRVNGGTFRNLITNVNQVSYDPELAGPEFLVPVQDADTITPYSYYYEFQVFEDSIVDVSSGYYIDDVLRKTLYNTTTRILEDVPKFRDTITQAEYDALPEHRKISFSVNQAVEPLGSSQIDNNIKNYGVGQAFRVITTQSGFFIRTDYYIIKSIYDEDAGSAASLTNPDEDFESTNYRTEKLPYRLDAEILSYTGNILSPEFTFAGGKNLLEVLFEIGKTFNGIPRLLYRDDEEEVITFDILSRLEDINAIGYENAFINKSSDSDNYATGLVTVIENAIDDELAASGTNFYPNKYSWIKPKSKNIEDAIFGLDNMAINIENNNSGIYKIKRVLVRNWDSSNTVLDITSQVLEKRIYDTKEPVDTDQGKFLYYIRGKNTIEGLSNLPPKDSIIGSNGEEYAIHLVIKAVRGNDPISSIDKKDFPIPEYEFQIEYYPIINKARLFSEQSKLTGETRKIYNSFSQPERNISLTQFSENAETILKRTGVNSITSRYVINDVSEMPFIGEILNVDSKKYYADMINIQYDNNSILAEAEYTRDINKLDKYVGYRKSYREYEIFADDIVQKNKNINKYCYITVGGTDQLIPDRYFSGNSRWRDSIRQLFNGNISIEKIDSAIYQMFDIEGRRLIFAKDEANPASPNAEFEKVSNIILPVISNYTNNSLVFISSMYDNFSAGNRLEPIAYEQNYLDGVQELIQKGFDEFGELTGLEKSNFYNFLGSKIVVIDGNQDGYEDNRKKLDFVRYADSFNRAPVIKYSLGYSDESFSTLKVPEFYSDKDMINYTGNYMTDVILADKDNKEAIQMVSQLHFIAKDPKMTILSPFMKYNRLIANEIYEEGLTLTEYTGRLQMIGIKDIRRAIDEKRINFSASDVLDSPLSANNSSFQSLYTMFVTGAVITPQSNYEGWGFVYPETGEVAILYEAPLTTGQTYIRPTIYFQLSDEQRL